MVQSWNHFYLLNEQVHCPSVRKLSQNFTSFHCGRDSLQSSAQERIQLTNQPQTNSYTQLSVLSTGEDTYSIQIFKDTILLLFLNQHSSYCPCHHCYQDKYPKSNSSRKQEVFQCCVCVLPTVQRSHKRDLFPLLQTAFSNPQQRKNALRIEPGLEGGKFTQWCEEDYLKKGQLPQFHSRYQCPLEAVPGGILSCIEQKPLWLSLGQSKLQKGKCHEDVK